MKQLIGKLSISAPPDPTKILWSDFLIFRNAKSEVAVNRAAGDFPEHLHEFAEIVFIVSGRGQHLTGSFVHDVAPGDFIISLPGERHLFCGSTLEFKRLNVQVRHACYKEAVEAMRASSLDVSAFDGRYQALAGSLRGSQLLPPPAFRECLDIALAMEREWLEAPPGFGPLLKGKLMELLVVIARAVSDCASGAETSRRRRGLQDAIDLIHSDYPRPGLDVSELQKAAGLERRSLERAFKSGSGLSPKQYLLTTRISWACRMLAHRGMRISETATACGFQSQSYFSRAFRRAIGLSPGEFIARNRPAKGGCLAKRPPEQTFPLDSGKKYGSDA